MKQTLKYLKVWWWSVWGVLSLSVAAWAGEAAGGPAEFMDEMTVTATRFETAVKNVPASVTVIHAEDLDLGNFPNQDIGDALRSVPGVGIRRAYAPFPSSANIRGVGSSGTVYLVNGIPTDYQISQAIPVEMVARVEIIRGPASALYGANASGGVINIILKEGKADPKGQVKFGYGSFDRFRSALSSEGKVGKFSYAVGGFYEDSDGTNVVTNNVNPSIHMIDDCDYDKKGGTVTAGYAFSDATRVKMFYSTMTDRYTRGRPNVGGDWDYHFAGVSLSQDIGSRVRVNGYAAVRADKYLHLYDRGRTNYDPSRKRDTDYDEDPLELSATFRLDGGHTLTSGIFYNNQSTDQQYRDRTGTTPSYTYRNEFKVQTFSGFVQDVWEITDQWVLTAGLRYDHWENYDNFFETFTTTNPADRTDENVSPRAGIRYNLSDATSFFANYGMGFNPPTSEQLYDDRTSGGNPRQPNPDLKAETTHSWELGMDRWFGSRVQSSISLFYNVTDDKIMSWFDASNTYINKNIGQSRSYGSEVSLAFYPTDNWILAANYTFNVATIEENPSNPSLEGNDLPFSPRHKANLSVTYRKPENFALSVGCRFLSDQYSDDANTVSNAGGVMMMEQSFVVDIKGTKYFALNHGPLDRIAVSLGVDNLFDEYYRTMYMYEDPGTTFFAEVAFDF